MDLIDIPRPTMLRRQTNAYWGLSPEDRLRWDAATTLDAREAIEQEHRTRYRLDDLFGAGAAAEQEYEPENNLFGAAEQGAEQVAVAYWNREPENNRFGDLDAFGT
jgi:hypothetical protein